MNSEHIDLEELAEKKSILNNIQNWVENAKFIQIAGYGDPFFRNYTRNAGVMLGLIMT